MDKPFFVNANLVTHHKKVTDLKTRLQTKENMESNYLHLLCQAASLNREEDNATTIRLVRIAVDFLNCPDETSREEGHRIMKGFVAEGNAYATLVVAENFACGKGCPKDVHTSYLMCLHILKNLENLPFNRFYTGKLFFIKGVCSLQLKMPEGLKDIRVSADTYRYKHALYYLGHMHFVGKDSLGNPALKDVALAEHFFVLAEEQGHPDAREALHSLCKMKSA